MAEAKSSAAAMTWKAFPGMLANWRDIAVPMAVLGIVIALITPLPGFVLDILIVTDIMMSVVVMMVSMYITRPVEFSVFPTTLLMLTLFRLALKVCPRTFIEWQAANAELKALGVTP